MSGIAHCPSCSSTRTDAAGGCLSCGRKSVDQLPPTPTTDRDELVELFREAHEADDCNQMMDCDPRTIIRLQLELQHLESRIQADAAIIERMQALVEFAYREGHGDAAENDDRIGMANRHWEASFTKKRLAALKGGDHGIAAMGEGDVR